ncbi:MAG: DUF1572 family protein [Chloroflexi bacterium]|nr:DUF1572 family protein [Chloroflexota bacterium]
MEPEAQAYLDSLQSLFDQTKQALEGLPPQAINWKPLAKDTNSPAVLVAHMCGSAGQLVYQVLTGKDAGRQREAEFVATARSASDLLTLINKAEAQAKEGLAAATSRTLGESVAFPGRDPLSRRGWLQRSIVHLGTHVGHLQLTRQLWDTQKK